MSARSAATCELNALRPLLVREIHVTHKAPPYASEYDRIFQVPILFESGWNAIRLDEAAMPARMAMQPPYVQALLNERAEALLKELEGSKTMRGRNVSDFGLRVCHRYHLLPSGKTEEHK